MACNDDVNGKQQEATETCADLWQLKFGTKILTTGDVDVLDWFSLVVRLGLVSLA